jgi:hypothetical protein
MIGCQLLGAAYNQGGTPLAIAGSYRPSHGPYLEAVPLSPEMPEVLQAAFDTHYKKRSQRKIALR